MLSPKEQTIHSTLRGRKFGAGGANWKTALPAGAFSCFLVSCAVAGGSARADAPSLVFLLPATVLCLATMAVGINGSQLRQVRGPLVFLLAWALTIGLQLVPIPPALWFAMPGHERFAALAKLTETSSTWRPISLTPDLTWISLLSVLPALAAVIGMASIDQKYWRYVPLGIIVFACLSAFLGVLQATTDPYGLLYYYSFYHDNAATGFLANRNHQALLLAMAFPAIRAWTMLEPSIQMQRRKVMIALPICAFIVAMLLVTGSRAGLLLGLGGMLFAALMAPLRFGQQRQRRSAGILVAAAAFIIILATVGLFAYSDRAFALDRFLGTVDIVSEQRLRVWPLIMKMAVEYLPFGTGVGSFDPIFRVFEPNSELNLTFLNRAHNDLLELVLTGGLAQLIVLITFILWWCRQGWTLRRPRASQTSDLMLMGRLGWAIILLALVASIVDYPLRTPIMEVIFAIACVLIAGAPYGRASHPSRPAPAQGELI